MNESLCIGSKGDGRCRKLLLRSNLSAKNRKIEVVDRKEGRRRTESAIVEKRRKIKRILPVRRRHDLEEPISMCRAFSRKRTISLREHSVIDNVSVSGSSWKLTVLECDVSSLDF